MEWKCVSPGDRPDGEIVLSGDFDLYNAPRFSAYALRGIADGWTGLTLDMGGVEYLDSTGVGSIIRLSQALRAKGGRLRVRGLNDTPRRVLKLSNILPIIEEIR